VFHGFVVLRQLKGVGLTSYSSFQKSLEAILLSYCNFCIENCDLLKKLHCRGVMQVEQCNSKLLETFKNQFCKFLEIEEAMRQNELSFISQKW
jgi:hypothetical protein